MRTPQEIRQELRKVQRYMRLYGIRRTSFMNGGLDDRTYRANARLFALKVELQQAEEKHP